MRIRQLTYELKRPIPLVLASIAALVVLIAAVIAWQWAEERHDLRRQARLLMVAERTAHNQLEQMQQTAGTLTMLTARTTAQQQELSRMEGARAQAQAQLAQLQQELQAQQSTRAELAKTREADARRVAELRSQEEQASTRLNTLRDESAGLELRTAELKRELEEAQRQLDDTRVADAKAQQQREQAETHARAGDQASSASGEQRGSTPRPVSEAPTHPQALATGAIALDSLRDSLRASKLAGVPVIGLDHISVGEIEDVLIGPDRAGVIVIRTGGFLGLGGKRVGVAFDQVLWNTGDVSRALTPSASLTVGDAPQPSVNPAERMPGAQISTEALRANEEATGARVSAETGPVTTGTAERATTLLVGRSGGPVQAMVRLTKAELEQAPGFEYAAPR